MDRGEGHGPRKELFTLYGKSVCLGTTMDVRTAMQSMAARQLMAKMRQDDMVADGVRLLECQSGAGVFWLARRGAQ